jgi:single-stranded-DNA-specific exonuclease
LITEDPDVAYECIDRLLALNTQRRAAQDKSLIHFEQAVLEQCAVESDPVLIAHADDLEPSVTGLAAQSLVRKYGRPTFLFVRQGTDFVGSGRGIAGVDLFQWVETHQASLVKYGGHQGAVGLTIRMEDFSAFRGQLLKTAQATMDANGSKRALTRKGEVSPDIEAEVSLQEIDPYWWNSFERLGPFGQGYPQPLFRLTGVDVIAPISRRTTKRPAKEIVLKDAQSERRAILDDDQVTLRAQEIIQQINKDALLGPWGVVGYPTAARKGEKEFKWTIVDLWRLHG